MKENIKENELKFEEIPQESTGEITETPKIAERSVFEILFGMMIGIIVIYSFIPFGGGPSIVQSLYTYVINDFASSTDAEKFNAGVNAALFGPYILMFAIGFAVHGLLMFVEGSIRAISFIKSLFKKKTKNPVKS
jgi:hypothetical protein